MKKITAIMLAVFIAMVATSFVACKMACAGCNGTGTCSRCYGKGIVDYRKGLPEGTNFKCLDCNGSGDCPMCEGKQKVKKSDNNNENIKDSKASDEAWTEAWTEYYKSKYN